MRHKKNKVKSGKLKGKRMIIGILISTFTFLVSPAMAQESLNTTGDNTSGSGGSASYSIGQVVYTTNTGTSGSVAHGVQQPFEILVVTGIEETKGRNFTVSAYPNPTSGYLTLSISEIDISNLSYQLFDMQGRLLHRAKITGNQTSIVMSDFEPAVYFVIVSQGNKDIKTFRIVKSRK